MNTMQAGTKNKGGRPRKEKMDRIRSLYMGTIDKTKVVPDDLTASIMLDCSKITIWRIRESLKETHDITPIEQPMFSILPKPKPEPVIEPPDLMTRIGILLGNLPKDKLEVLEELLQDA